MIACAFTNVRARLHLNDVHVDAVHFERLAQSPGLRRHGEPHRAEDAPLAVVVHHAHRQRERRRGSSGVPIGAGRVNIARDHLQLRLRRGMLSPELLELERVAALPAVVGRQPRDAEPLKQRDRAAPAPLERLRVGLRLRLGQPNRVGEVGRERVPRLRLGLGLGGVRLGLRCRLR